MNKTVKIFGAIIGVLLLFGLFFMGSYNGLVSQKANVEQAEGTVHGFDYDKRQEGVSVFYGRDRGEDWESIKPITIQNTVFDEHTYYNYLYDVEQGRWLVSKNGKNFQGLKETVAKHSKIEE